MSVLFDTPRLMWHGGHRVRLLETGREFFPALRRACDAAQRIIRLETYIFCLDDPTGRAVLDCLAKAAARGVRVQLVVDGVGSRNWLPALEPACRQYGIDLRVFRPERGRRLLDRQRLRRLHRKLFTADDQIAIVGGINIIDDHHDPNHGRLEHARYDFALEVEGPVVGDVVLAQRHLWLLLEWAGTGLRPAGLWGRLKGLQRRLSESLRAQAAPPAMPHEGSRLALVLRDNLRHRHSIERLYIAGLRRAEKRVRIACAYFFPGTALRRAILDTAARGITVELLLQGRAEYRLPHWGTQAIYDDLLSAGVRIFEYHASFMHAKVAVFDDWATVGSANLDPFSLLMAREANLAVADAELANALWAALDRGIAEGAQPVTLETWRAQGFWPRAWRSLVARLLRLAVLLASLKPY
jgi:cardiolipin synthase